MVHFGEEDDRLGVVVPEHAPEVLLVALQRVLGDDELPQLGVAVEPRGVDVVRPLHPGLGSQGDPVALDRDKLPQVTTGLATEAILSKIIHSITPFSDSLVIL